MASEPPTRHEFDPDKLILRLNLQIPGEREAIGPLVERILEIVQDLKCAGGKEDEIELALHEALANAVVHGCREDPGKVVQVTVSCDEGRGIVIVVRDPGVGFDPEKVASPLHGERLFFDHGRGIYLINQLMDEVRYEKGGAEIWMRKR